MMNHKEIIREFNKFLKTNHCYARYRVNAERGHERNPEYYSSPLIWNKRKLKELSETNYKYRVRGLISEAFGWNSSPEGYTFWANLSSTWYGMASKLLSDKNHKI